MADVSNIVQNYDVLTALRGPDHVGAEGAAEWKLLVIAPLRYEVGKAFGFDLPHTWCIGAACYSQMSAPCLRDDETVEAARRFAQSKAAHHVKTHAAVAWRIVDRAYYSLLNEQGLL